MPSPSSDRLVIAALVAVVAGTAYAADPVKKEDAAKLEEYQVGGGKKLPKAEGSVAKVERPKAAVDAGIQFEKPTIEIAPMVVAPMQVAPPPAAAPAPVAAAKVPAAKPASMAPAKAASAAGSAAAVPVAPTPRPAPAGALPQAAGGGGGEITLVPISTPAPEYPREAALTGATGYVVVAFTLNLEGVPQDISIVESSTPRMFDQSARRAVARWRFQPVVVNGLPVERKVQRRIDFK